MYTRGDSGASRCRKSRSHKAKTTSAWKKRLRRFAAGESFKRGERPPKGSYWDSVIIKILACPAHGRESRTCSCQYHPSSPYVQQPVSSSTPDVSDDEREESLVLPPATVAPGTIAREQLNVVDAITPSRPVTPSPIVLTPSSVSLTPSSVLLVPTSLYPPSTSTTVTSTTMVSRSVRIVDQGAHTSSARPTGISNVTISRLSIEDTRPSSTVPPTTISSSPIATCIAGRSPVVQTPVVAGFSLKSTNSTCANTTHTPTTAKNPNPLSLSPSTRSDNIESHILTTKLSRQPTDYTLRLPIAWREHMNVGDQQWIGRAVFSAQNCISDAAAAKLWWYPPMADSRTAQPKPESYVLRRICVWMPRRAWNIDFTCPNCPRSLHSKGLYKKTIRRVVDLRDYYYLATEELGCDRCKKSFQSWDSRLLSQLTESQVSLFPAILTYHLACDKAVVSLLRGRTLGNSPTALRNAVYEVHCEEWTRKQLRYLDDCGRYRQGRTALLSEPSPVFADPVPFEGLPSERWFMSVYARDILSRLPQLLATCTGVFGLVLKIDSTKKVCGKLQGTAAGSASWCTNVSNERGEVLISVLTESEGLEGLRPMAMGLIRRYEKARQEPPLLLYTDRDCCSVTGIPKCAQLFAEWDHLQVRLDIWHFMRRLARGCTTESHPLYGVVMGRLSQAIFEWDSADYGRLCEAKKGCLQQQGVSNPSDSAIRNAINKEELSRHCRRRTRGAEETYKAIEDLLLQFTPATDSLGVPVFSEQMVTIWNEEKKHVKCIQDPPGVALYTVTGHIMKGGIELPVFRVARGTTSLESFHLHLARFIPGSSASDVHFQAFLLEGLARWNLSRRLSSAHQQPSMRVFDLQLAYNANKLSESILGSKLLPHHHPPTESNEEELFGVSYLYHQAGRKLEFTEDNMGAQEKHDERTVDEGFIDEGTGSETPYLAEEIVMDDVEASSVAEEEQNDCEEEMEEDSITTSNSTDTGTVDSRGIAGWDKVARLAEVLVELEGLSVSEEEAQRIKTLWDALDSFDKKATNVFLRSPPTLRGHFCSQKRTGHTTKEQMRRCFLSGVSVPLSPHASRIVEAICMLLCNKHMKSGRISSASGQGRTYVSRWDKVLQDYSALRARLFNSLDLLEGTNLLLYAINKTTLQKWHQKEERRKEALARTQGLELSAPPLCAQEDLTPANQQPLSLPTPPAPFHQFPQPEDTSGQARRRGDGTQMGARVMCTIVPSASQPSLSACNNQELQLQEQEVQTSSVSRTTLWRREKKRIAQAIELGQPVPLSQERKKHKQHECGQCHQPLNVETNHAQYYGKWYCPNITGQVPVEQWKAEQKALRNQRRQQQQPSFH